MKLYIFLNLESCCFISSSLSLRCLDDGCCNASDFEPLLFAFNCKESFLQLLSHHSFNQEEYFNSSYFIYTFISIFQTFFYNYFKIIFDFFFNSISALELFLSAYSSSSSPILTDSCDSDATGCVWLSFESSVYSLILLMLTFHRYPT